MTDVADFLHARYAEQRDWQNRIFRSTWRYGNPCTECGRPADNLTEFIRGDREVTRFEPCGCRVYDPNHLSRYREPAADPAVLADLDAKAAIVQAYAAVEANDIDEPSEYAYGWANGLGLAVRALATAYANHPDYKQDWRP